MNLDPLYWLDCRDRFGRPDSQKILPIILFFAALVFHWFAKPLPPLTLTILGAIAFGPRMYGLYLKRAHIGKGAGE